MDYKRFDNEKYLKFSWKILKIILVFLLVIFVFFYLYNLVMKKFIYPINHLEIVQKYAKEYEIDQFLVFSIIKAESNFNSKAKSNKGALGLMQILPSTAEFIANKTNTENYNLLSPSDNIKFGCYYLRYLFDKYVSRKEVLCAYNAGEGNLAKWLKDIRYSIDGITIKNIPFNETNEYVKRVEKNLNYYVKYYGNILDKQKEFS